MEQRAQFLKRLDFAIFCSEMDQYTRSLPDIQERLAESLRLAQVPVVHEQVCSLVVADISIRWLTFAQFQSVLVSFLMKFEITLNRSLVNILIPHTIFHVLLLVL